MLIDWITAYLPMEKIPENDWSMLRLLTERIMRFKPNTDNHRLDDVYMLIDRDTVVYETSAWESVRSDSHQIAFRVGSDAVWIQGSPARLCGSGDAVFGEGASHAIDLKSCLIRMVAFVSQILEIQISNNPDHWHITRIDVTGNLLLDDLVSVRESLRILRNCEGGRYRVSQQSGDTVYWSHTSRLRSGKAYAKGPHIQYQLKNPKYNGRRYTDQECRLIDRLLRLELKLGSQWLRERAGKSWQQLTPQDLKNEWKNYFYRMIGDSEMKTNDDLLPKIMAVSKTKGQAKSAHCCFLLIQQMGWERAKDSYPSTSWYRNIKILRDAGLGDADISAGNIVTFRRKIIEFQNVETWNHLYQLAA